MTIDEAIRILDPKTTAEALAEVEYYGGFSGQEAVIKAVEDACMIAIAALEAKKQPPPGERLTKRLGDGQAVMDCENCKQHERGCTAQYCRNRLKDRLAEYEDARGGA